MYEKNRLTFMDYLDTVLCLNRAAWEDHGEDCFYCGCGEGSGLISVMDGCGGLGSRTYGSMKGKTGAYISSRIVSGAVRDWYHDRQSGKWSGETMTNELRSYIDKRLQVAASYDEGGLKIRGSMVRDFPTTMALAVARLEEEQLCLHIVWAGDSRIYLLDQKGLAQLTEDDTDSEDAYDNLYSDGVLNNVISSDGRYDLHYKKFILKEPTLVIAATDGCFSYLPTPMEFEYLILTALQNAASPTAFRNELAEKMVGYAGDDLAMGMMSFGFGDFFTTVNVLEKRTKELYTSYIKPLESRKEDSDIMRLWQQYKTNYGKYINQ